MTPERLAEIEHRARWMTGAGYEAGAFYASDITDLIAYVRELEARNAKVARWAAAWRHSAHDHRELGQLEEGVSASWRKEYHQTFDRMRELEAALREIADRRTFCSGSPFCEDKPEGRHDPEMCAVAMARAALAPSEQKEEK